MATNKTRPDSDKPKGAARTKLAHGENSIDRVTPHFLEKRQVWEIRWHLRLYDGKVVQKRSSGKTKGLMRKNAHNMATELLASNGRHDWKPSSKLTDYIEQVCKPELEKNEDLSDDSRRLYLRIIKLLLADCDKHRHADSLKGYTIVDGMRFRPIQAALRDLSMTHGYETARQAKNVLSKHVAQQLIHDDLIAGNPIRGMSFNLGKRPPRIRGGKATTHRQWLDVIDYLIHIDPAAEIAPPKRGRYSHEDRIAKRRNAIAMMILQAITGLRAGEATKIHWDAFVIDDDGQAFIYLEPEMTKNHKGRKVVVMHPGAAQYLIQRRKATGGQGYIVGSPTDATKRWEQRNYHRQAAELYKEVARNVGIDLLKVQRTHIWRVTLNSLTRGLVPEADRAANYGHDPKTNRASYTDTSDPQLVVDASHVLAPGPE